MVLLLPSPSSFLKLPKDETTTLDNLLLNMHEDEPSTENSTEDKEIANKPEMSYGREQKILAWQE